ncbi:hypothetical protein KEM54_006962 [Ascosphaera aggregata]|nr:hypothetical protein KEM54_006962 [Ascosphaera aggregata]
MAISGGSVQPVRVPTASSLPDSLRIRSDTPALLKYFKRLSRTSIINLVLRWLDDNQSRRTLPYLAPLTQEGAVRNGHEKDNDKDEDEDDEERNADYPPATCIRELRNVYEGFLQSKGGKRDVIDRILEGDWRNGLSLGQLAMLDMLYLDEHPNGLHKWTAFRIEASDKAKHEQDGRQGPAQYKHPETAVPRLHPASFLHKLQQEISTLVKAHFHIHRSSFLPITFIRIFVMNSPFNTPQQSSYVYVDSSRLIYLAFPDGAPFVYASFAPSHFSTWPSTIRDTSNQKPAMLNTDTNTLRLLIRDAIPKALSRQHCRFKLCETGLTSKNIHSLLALRGAGRTNESGGAYSVFADAVVEGVPLDIRPANASKHRDTATRDHENIDWSQGNEISPEDRQATKKRKLLARQRFGTLGELRKTPTVSGSTTQLQSPTTSDAVSTTLPHYQPVLEHLEVHLQDPVAEANDINNSGVSLPATMSLTFGGSDVISGIRLLAERGVIDLTRMPSYLTGEEAMSRVQVKNGQRVGKMP